MVRTVKIVMERAVQDAAQDMRLITVLVVRAIGNYDQFEQSFFLVVPVICRIPNCVSCSTETCCDMCEENYEVDTCNCNSGMLLVILL